MKFGNKIRNLKSEVVNNGERLENNPKSQKTLPTYQLKFENIVKQPRIVR